MVVPSQVLEPYIVVFLGERSMLSEMDNWQKGLIIVTKYYENVHVSITMGTKFHNKLNKNQWDDQLDAVMLS
jgi:hypothetical protein